MKRLLCGRTVQVCRLDLTVQYYSIVALLVPGDCSSESGLTILGVIIDKNSTNSIVLFPSLSKPTSMFFSSFFETVMPSARMAACEATRMNRQVAPVESYLELAQID